MSEMKKSQRDVLMTHLIACYPDYDTSLTVAKGMIDGGASYLEIQFPFSDPSADGPVIQKACSDALDAGFTLQAGFKLIQEIHDYSEIPVFVMNYGNVPYTYRLPNSDDDNHSNGLRAFMERCVRERVAGLIIPDLVLGTDEGLYRYGKELGIPVLPVVVPTISRERLQEFIELQPEYIYIAMRTGITGKETEIDTELIEFFQYFKESGIKTLAGFGVRRREQVAVLAEYVHGAIVGSALVNEISNHIDESREELYITIKNRVAGLIE